MHVVVLGAGIIGTASAWFLRADGHDVTVIERQPGVALETSFANACQISVSHSEPWANPDAPRKILQWLGREDAPLLFRLRFDPQLWLWGLAFLRECLPEAARRNTRACLAIALYSRTLLKQLRRELALEYDHLERGILHFYTDARAFGAAQASAALMRGFGCDRRIVSADEAVAIEPALAPARPRIVGGDYCAEDESGDVLAFTRGLAGRAAARGVVFRFNHLATRILAERGRVIGVEMLGPDGWHETLAADAIVVAAGAFSRALLAPLGERLPLYPAKGYSATFEIVDPTRAPAVSVTDDECKIAISRLGNRLRVAGTAEFDGYSRALNPTRCEALTQRVRTLFPGACDYDRPRYWAGLRPATPSNVPIIGRTRIRGLYVNTGHGTLGWTMGVGAGQLIADVVAGRTPAVAVRGTAQ